jgi:hypothetical protein
MPPEGPATLVRATVRGVATRRAPAGAAGRGATLPPLPPLPPPAGGWRAQPWSARCDAGGTYDLDLLLNELLTLASPRRDPMRPLRAAAARLRADVLRGRPVTVYELPKAAERGLPRGQARLRYWVGRDGVLHRLELRTRTGGFAQLDVATGAIPPLPSG